MKYSASIVAVLAALVAVPSQGAAPPPAPAATESPEIGKSPEQERAKLNMEEAQRARRQAEEIARRNAAAQEAYQQAVDTREAQIIHQREVAQQQQAEYEAAMARWRADVAACQAGDRSKCAPLPAK